MIEVMLTNLLYIGAAFGIFALCVIANIIVSIYENTNIFNEPFSTTKFITGIIKMLSVGLTTAILAVVMTLLPYLLSQTGFNIPENIENIFTFGSIIALYYEAIKKYFLEAYNSIKNILENKNVLGE